MDYATAKKLVDHLKHLDESFNAATLITDEIVDIEERRKFRKALADIITKVYIDIMLPISTDFPDLLPGQTENKGE